MHTENSSSSQVRLVIAKIRDAATKGTAVDMSELLNSFVNDVVCHAVFGKVLQGGRPEQALSGAGRGELIPARRF